MPGPEKTYMWRLRTNNLNHTNNLNKNVQRNLFESRKAVKRTSLQGAGPGRFAGQVVQGDSTVPSLGTAHLTPPRWNKAPAVTPHNCTVPHKQQPGPCILQPLHKSPWHPLVKQTQPALSSMGLSPFSRKAAFCWCPNQERSQEKEPSKTNNWSKYRHLISSTSFSLLMFS